nr:MAG TPA: hypothetical protein [Caudoviricetes sp.]DAU58840.1 MAG TPA: hypothetical protein [Caudoviricetes sp.]
MTLYAPLYHVSPLLNFNMPLFCPKHNCLTNNYIFYHV